MSELYSLSAKLNSGKEQPLSDYRGKVLLIVNTASACGFTPQYEGLQTLYEAYKGKGLEVLAFPCNQFGKQESGADSEIRNFCDLNFHISFPLFQKIEVNGANAHPIYQFLTTQKKGLLGSKNIKWNFTKFLVNAQGAVVKRYAPTTKPKDLAADIESLLSSLP